MLDRTSFHDRFTQMLGGDDDALAPWLADPAHAERLWVYRNNVVTAWADTVVKNYPAVERLVGTEFMRGMALAFTKTRQPESPVLTLYGEGFADFIESFPPAAKLPYLADVARLDRAWTEAFFAESVAPLKPEALAGLSEDEMAALTFQIHPSARLIRSRWNARDIWKANRTEQPETRIWLVEASTIALVWWSPDGMADRTLTEVEASMLEAIKSGLPLGEALGSSAATEEDQVAVFAFLSEALVAGLFIAPKE